MDYSKKNNNIKIKNHKSKKDKVKTKARLTLGKIILILLLISGFAGFGALAGIYMGILKNAPKLNVSSVQPNIYSSQIITSDSKKLYQMLDASEKRIYATLDEIPTHLQEAFIAIEDSRFYSHNGVDVKAFLRAIYTVLTTNSSQGGSTLTQQLIKNARNLTSNNIISKLQEQYLAIQFEKELLASLGTKQKSKEYILELYLNEIALGNGLNGVRTATTFYFDKELSELTLSESAVLASITQYPSALSPNNNPTANKGRATTVLSYMHNQAFISDDEFVAATRDLNSEDGVYQRIKSSRKIIEEQISTYSYYTDQVIKDITEDLLAIGYTNSEATRLIYNGGLTIEIPIDLEIQNILEETYLDESFFPENQFEIELQYMLSVKNELTDEVKHYNRKTTIKNQSEIIPYTTKVKNSILTTNDIVLDENVIPIVQPQSSFVVIDHTTGAVKGVVGGRGEKTANRSLNRATQSFRQPGSVFKILSVYAPAFDLNILSPGSVLDDVPLPIDKDGHTINNWNDKYEGLTTVRRGVYMSINTLAIRGLDLVGIDTSYAYLKNFGFTSLTDALEVNGQIFTDKTPSLALGGITKGVSNLEITSAFGSIANSGIYERPYFYTNVYDHSGQLILSNKRDPKQILSPETSYLLTNVMEDVVIRGTGINANFKDMSVAGKTGTTSDSKDLIFSGYTPYYTATVFYGYDLPKTIEGDKNVSKKLWSHIMEEIHLIKKLPDVPFYRPNTIVTKQVSKDSGLLPNEYTRLDPRGNRIVTEIFNKNFVPTKVETVHGFAKVDTTTNLLATKFCPPSAVKEVAVLDKVNNKDNIYSYVENYDTVVMDAKYERPKDYCNVHTPTTLITDEDFYNYNTDFSYPFDNTIEDTEDEYNNYQDNVTSEDENISRDTDKLPDDELLIPEEEIIEPYDIPEFDLDLIID